MSSAKPHRSSRLTTSEPSEPGSTGSRFRRAAASERVSGEPEPGTTGSRFRRAAASERVSGEPFDAATVYDAYAPFVWRCLQRMGVPEADLEDSLQEVFVVVHRKLSGYCAERAKLSTWLFGIGVNVARKHRSKKRGLVLGLDLDAAHCRGPGPDQQLQTKQDAQRLQAILSRLKPEHSATFVMFELEGLSCHEIADLTGVPVGTVYSRLHKAREQFRGLASQFERAKPKRFGWHSEGP